MRLRTLTRASSRLLLIAVYVVALFPVRVGAIGSTVSVSADDPYVDYALELDGETLLHVTASSGVDCPLDFDETPDPWLILFDSTGATVASDDDGNHNESGECYSAKLHLVPSAGEYVLRFTTFQRESGGEYEVPTGSMEIEWSTEGYSPPTTTSTSTTTSTTTTTSSTTSTTTTTEAPPSTTTTTTTLEPPTTTTPPTTSTSTSSTTSTTTTSTTTTAPPTTTTVPPTTTSTTSSTTSTTTSTTVPPTTTSTTTVPPTTTTTVAPTTTTAPPPPPTTLPPTTSTTTTTTTSTTLPEPPTTTIPPVTTLPPTTTVPVPTTTVPPRLEEAEAIVADLEDEELRDAIVEVVSVEPDEIEVADVEALVELETFDDLPDEELGQVAVALNDAPEEAKEIFEEAVADELFDGALDSYVPVDSTIDVEDRRTVIAVTSAGAVLAVPRPSPPPPPAPTAGPGPSAPDGPRSRRSRR